MKSRLPQHRLYSFSEQIYIVQKQMNTIKGLLNPKALSNPNSFIFRTKKEYRNIYLLVSTPEFILSTAMLSAMFS